MEKPTEIAFEAAGIAYGNKMLVTGGGAGIVGWLASLNWLGLIGTAVAVMGLAANVYFQKRRDSREQAEQEAERLRQERREAREEAEHLARMAAIAERCAHDRKKD